MDPEPEFFALADSGSGIIIPDPDQGRLLLEQAHHAVTPIQEVKYATLGLEADWLLIRIRYFLPLWIWIRNCPSESGSEKKK